MAKRILIYTNHYFPEQFKINDVVDWLKGDDFKIRVITGTPNYPRGTIYSGYGIFSKKSVEIKDNLTINRLPLIPRGSGSKLFIVFNYGFNLTEELKDTIKKAIKLNASPRHVPSKIIAVSEIPKTKNGKIVELAVKQTVEGGTIKNLEALANPDSLKEFKNIKELNE